MISLVDGVVTAASPPRRPFRRPRRRCVTPSSILPLPAGRATMLSILTRFQPFPMDFPRDFFRQHLVGRRVVERALHEARRPCRSPPSSVQGAAAARCRWAGAHPRGCGACACRSSRAVSVESVARDRPERHLLRADPEPELALRDGDRRLQLVPELVDRLLDADLRRSSVSSFASSFSSTPVTAAMIFSVTSMCRKLISHWSRSVLVGRSNLTRRVLVFRCQLDVRSYVVLTVRLRRGALLAHAARHVVRRRGAAWPRRWPGTRRTSMTVTVLSLKVNSSGARVSSARHPDLGALRHLRALLLVDAADDARGCAARAPR